MAAQKSAADDVRHTRNQALRPAVEAPGRTFAWSCKSRPKKERGGAGDQNMIKATEDGTVAVRPAIQWWSSLAVIAGAYLTCCLLLPPLISGDLSLTVSLTWLKEAAPLLGTACAAIATFAFFRRLDLRRLSETQNEIDE